MRNQLRRAVKAKASYGRILVSCMGRKMMGQHLGREDPEVGRVPPRTSLATMGIRNLL